VGLFDRKERKPKTSRRSTGDRLKSAGAREYEARRHERRAEALEASGDTAGAQAERDLAAAVRTK
jgi:hypothetical protein